MCIKQTERLLSLCDLRFLLTRRLDNSFYTNLKLIVPLSLCQLVNRFFIDAPKSAISIEYNLRQLLVTSTHICPVPTDNGHSDWLFIPIAKNRFEGWWFRTVYQITRLRNKEQTANPRRNQISSNLLAVVGTMLRTHFIIQLYYLCFFRMRTFINQVKNKGAHCVPLFMLASTECALCVSINYTGAKQSGG